MNCEASRNSENVQDRKSSNSLLLGLTLSIILHEIVFLAVFFITGPIKKTTQICEVKLEQKIMVLIPCARTPSIYPIKEIL